MHSTWVKRALDNDLPKMAFSGLAGQERAERSTTSDLRASTYVTTKIALNPDPLTVWPDDEPKSHVTPKRTRIDPREIAIFGIWVIMVIGIIVLAASVMGQAVAS